MPAGFRWNKIEACSPERTVITVIRSRATNHRIAIVGAGAVGSYVGGYLARGAEDVTLIDPWPAHVEHMRRHGLSLSGLTAQECFTTPIKALHLSDVQALARERPIDIAFICVKSYDTGWAARLIRDYLSPSGFAVSLQNCMNEEEIASIVGWGRTVGCVASQISVELTAPGEVRRGVPRGGERHTVFRSGEVHGRITPRVEAVTELLSMIDSSRVTSNLWGERWSKLVVNAMRNSVSAATGMGSNACDREPITRRLSIRIAGEAVMIGLAHGFQLETIARFSPARWVAALEDDVEAVEAIETSMLESAATRSESMRPSMAQDVVKGRRTEVDFINGLVVAKGREAGIGAPANEGIVAAVKSVEQGRTAPGLDNVRHI